MSPSDNNPTPADPAPSPGQATGPADPSAQLAHELANLLDGSLRHLGIAINSLRPPNDTDQQDDSNTTAPAEDDELLGRLQTADQSMRQMVSLIHKWMKQPTGPRELYEQPQTLGESLEQVVKVHRPSADRFEIGLGLSIDEDAGALPAGPVFPIIANAVRNSIEAIAAEGPDTTPQDHRIQIRAELRDQQVYLTVTDDGPGLDSSMCDPKGHLILGRSTKPGGHGMGLTLSQQIAQSLGGSLRLASRPQQGAQFTLTYPSAGVRALAELNAESNTDTP